MSRRRALPARPAGSRSAFRASRALGLVALALLFTLPRGASGQAPTSEQLNEASAAIERGVALREQGKDEQALAELTHAYELAPTPRARAQLGLVEQALGKWVLAEKHVSEALVATGDPWITARRTVLEGALSTIGRHLGSLEVRGKAPTGDLFVDGLKIGALPLRAAERVEVGTRTLEVRAAGYYPVSRTIVISPGETARETIDLAPLPASPPTSLGAKEPLSPPPASPPSSASRTLAYVGFGVAGASLAVALTGLGLRASEIASYNGDAACPGESNPTQPAACASDLSAASTWKAVSIASFIGAGALGVASTVLFVTAPRRATAIACRTSGAGAECGLSF